MPINLLIASGFDSLHQYPILVKVHHLFTPWLTFIKIACPYPFGHTSRCKMDQDQDSSELLVLRVLLEELEELERTQDGKETNIADLLVALSSTKDRILALRTSLGDEKMALSMSSAILTDQSLLADMQDEKEVDGTDRGESAKRRKPNAPDTTKKAPKYDENDFVSTVMSDLMKRAAEDNKEENGEETLQPAASQTVDASSKCSCCLEVCDKTLLIGSCNHQFCHDCTKEMFLGAVKDEEMYPPRCCGNVVLPAVALRVLDYEELRSFSKKAMEWIAKDRLYCAEPKCSQFIPPSAIVNEIGTCPACRRQTHFTCRAFVHPNVDCPKDHGLQQVLKLAEARNWKRCSQCRAMVELYHGCNHITCR